MNMNGEYLRSFEDRLAVIRQLDPKSLLPKNDRRRQTIKTIKTGGFLQLDNKTFQVVEVGRYEETDDNHKKKTGVVWFELKLFCVETGQTVYLEWEEDDEIEISLTLREIKFSDLRDDAGKGVDEGDLDQVCEEEDSVFFNGQEFQYDDDCAAIYYRNDSSKGDRVWLYDFARGNEYLTIEEWPKSTGGEDYQIFLSRTVRPNEIEILSLGR